MSSTFKKNGGDSVYFDLPELREREMNLNSLFNDLIMFTDYWYTRNV